MPIILLGAGGGTYTLNSYVTQTQRLLHDASQNFWSTSELTDYINEARYKIAALTGCQRYLDTSLSLTVGVESYAFSTFAHPANIFDVWNITVVNSNERWSLAYMPWTEFTAFVRPWVSYQTRPTHWSKYGSNTIYVAPKPDQTYTTEIDTLEVPNTLIDNTTVEQLIYPFSDSVKYYAAYLAKKKEQSYGEAQDFMREFVRTLKEAVAASQMRRVRNIYDREQY